MERIASIIVKHPRMVIAVFVLLTILGGLMATQVRINYNLADYVPEHAPSTQALRVMEQEFDEQIPNARVYAPHVSVARALEIKAEIEALPHVDKVIWLDDFLSVTQPLETQPREMVEEFYSDSGALYQVIATLDDTPGTVASLREIVGEDGAVEGQLVDLSSAQASTAAEINTIMLIMVPAGVGLLLFSTRSWLEPPILLVTISVAIVINMGTDAFRSEVSFITQAVTAVLQLAVSMDYGIFLLHAKDLAIHRGMERKQAIAHSIVAASRSIVASSLTTILGFLALLFMSFRIGPDMGITLAKGVVFSLICVLIFMPAVLVLADPLLAKTEHRSLLPKFEGFAGFVSRSVVWLLGIGIVIPICFLAQSHLDFSYSNTNYPEGSRQARDREVVMSAFGQQLPMALMVPRGDGGREYQLEQDLAQIEAVSSITSYSSQVSHTIPSEVLAPERVSMLLSENYSRLLLTVETPKEGPYAFAVVDQIRAVAERYYPGTYHLVGESVVTDDMRASVSSDSMKVNALAIVSVGLVLLISFRSLSVPILLLLTIEGSIWINLTVPYLTGTHLAFIGYLVISTVQLGATVDYAILFTQHYLSNREVYLKREAVRQTIIQTFRTLLIPAAILTLAGVVLSIVSSMEVVSQLGTVLGRGAALSFVMVNLFLPAMLYLCDPLIEKTTWKAHFVRSEP